MSAPARVLVALLGLGLWLRLPAEASGTSQSVAVAAASDLVFCLPALHAEFAKLEPQTALRVTTGSSGNFFAQITHGAPFDVFLSADLSYPRALIAAGAADEKSLTLYGIGRLVVWTTRADLDPKADLAGLVRSAQVRRLAIANPAHAPYGRAARETLEKLGVWADAQPKLVLGDNIAQAAQFVQTGHADAGIVALALVLGAPPSRDTGRWAELPAHLHAPLEQGAVLTTRGAANPAAVRYLAFLRTPAARAVFERYGFRLMQ
ncbi:MAG: molybdate ABC transporter substrate-binding protein [Opitutaceae bacterium]|nr:molybdate ABC transporter substrate-binding protein [Opitutaceae bacterium]